MPDQTLSGIAAAEAAASRPAAAKRSWLPYLTLAALAEAVLLLRLLPHDPAILAETAHLMAPLYRMQQARQRAALLRNDPPLGAKVLGAGTARLTPLLASAARRGQPTILVFTGFCSECAAQALEDWQRLAARPGGLAVVVISRDTPKDIARFWREHRLTLPVLPDPNGLIAIRFNVAWTPRAYSVSADGRLLWIQKRIALSPGAIEQDVRAGGRLSG